MKSISLICLALWAALGGAHAQKVTQPHAPAPAPARAKKAEPAPPISTGAPVAPAAGTFQYEQKPITSRPYLVTPEQAQTIIDRFKAAYPKLGSPRVLIYVNRELVDDESGMHLSARSEERQITTQQREREFQADEKAAARAGGTNGTSISGSVVLGDVHTSGAETWPGRGKASNRTEQVKQKNTYRVGERKKASLSDRQTTRDVEQLFGRPLRMAGVSLADQRVATQLIGEKSLSELATGEGEQARKDREALGKVADVVLEILVSSRNVTVPEISGDKVYVAPDLQATAIRLADAKIIGQASSADLIGPDRQAGRVVRQFTVREITEATALSLMEDMLLGVQP